MCSRKACSAMLYITHRPTDHILPSRALQAVQRLLQPGLEDRACSLVGQLIMELLRHAGPQMVSVGTKRVSCCLCFQCCLSTLLAGNSNEWGPSSARSAGAAAAGPAASAGGQADGGGRPSHGAGQFLWLGTVAQATFAWFGSTADGAQPWCEGSSWGQKEGPAVAASLSLGMPPVLVLALLLLCMVLFPTGLPTSPLHSSAPLRPQSLLCVLAQLLHSEQQQLLDCLAGMQLG